MSVDPDARAAVLAAIRGAASAAAVALPALPVPSRRFPDRVARFGAALEAAAGTLHRVETTEGVTGTLRELPVYRDAARVLSEVEGVASRNLDPEAVADPRELAGLDLAILPSLLGVADCGAVYVDAGALHHRVTPFLAEHLVLVLPRSGLVDQLDDAYQMLSVEAASHGVWIAGPSKTADIEQALVIGAQGARTTQVILFG
jgi:L-lactate dehydrogenase complex protein LldG